MLSRFVKLSLVAVAFLVTTASAWATPTSSSCAPPPPKTCSCCWKVYLDGVDCCGCLSSSCGQCGTFYATLNCCTGCYTGKACGTTCNKKCCGPLTYKCKNFFCDPCYCVCVSTSCYTVGAKGVCTYTACGTASKCSSGTSTPAP